MPALDAAGPERELEGVCAVRAGDGVVDVELLRERSLEALRGGAAADEVVRVEKIRDEIVLSESVEPARRPARCTA